MERKYVYAGLVQLGALSAVVVDTSVYPKGFNLPAGMNAPKPLGIVVRGIVPEICGGYNQGSYEGVGQSPWPANMDKATPQGTWCNVTCEGPTRARAAGAWGVGDRLIIANNLGQLASVATLGLPVGSPINVLALAEEPASNPGDVAEVLVHPSCSTVVANPDGGVM